MADKAFLEDCEERNDDEQGGDAAEQKGDAKNEEYGAEVHGIAAPAIEAVTNERGGLGERLDRSRCCLEHSTRPHDHGAAHCYEGGTRIGERRGHDDGQRHRDVQDDHREHRDQRDLRRHYR